MAFSEFCMWSTPRFRCSNAYPIRDVSPTMRTKENKTWFDIRREMREFLISAWVFGTALMLKAPSAWISGHIGVPFNPAAAAKTGCVRVYLLNGCIFPALFLLQKCVMLKIDGIDLCQSCALLSSPKGVATELFKVYHSLIRSYRRCNDVNASKGIRSYNKPRNPTIIVQKTTQPASIVPPLSKDFNQPVVSVQYARPQPNKV